MSDYTYLSAAETAKLIRTQLKKYFPNTKFYVNSDTYSGGASIRVDWYDGPTTKQVKEITNSFSGARFDGMVDYKTHNNAWLLPDGSATFEKYERDYNTTIHYTKPHPDAKLVHFAADYIFENRHFTTAVKPIVERVCAEHGKSSPTFYERHAWIGKKERTDVTTLDWDSMDRAWGDYNDAHWINKYIHEALDFDMSNNPVVVTIDPQRVETEEIQITWDRDWTWIKFPEKPSEAVRDLLKNKLQARYSARRSAWYVCEQVAPDTIRIQLASL